MPCGPESSVPPHLPQPPCLCRPHPCPHVPYHNPVCSCTVKALVKGQGSSHHTRHTPGSGPPRATTGRTLLFLSVCTSVPPVCKAASDSPQPLRRQEAWWAEVGEGGMGGELGGPGQACGQMVVRKMKAQSSWMGLLMPAPGPERRAGLGSRCQLRARSTRLGLLTPAAGPECRAGLGSGR